VRFKIFRRRSGRCGVCEEEEEEVRTEKRLSRCVEVMLQQKTASERERSKQRGARLEAKGRGGGRDEQAVMSRQRGASREVQVDGQ
jgi:hypothetical protein